LHILHFLDNDRSNGSYNGIEINKPTYYTPDHSGLGYALNLRYTEQQYIRIPQLINLTLTSFTISTWIYLIEQIHTVNPIFSQCTTVQGTYSCLHCQIYSNNSLLFILADQKLFGSRSLLRNQWQHVAFVFENEKLTKSIYIDGIFNQNEHQMDFATVLPRYS
jgi:hypothetical protein